MSRKGSAGQSAMKRDITGGTYLNGWGHRVNQIGNGIDRAIRKRQARSEADIETSTCDDCGGTGYTVQGRTWKNGYREDQYGTCPTCFGHGTIEDGAA